MKKGILFGGLGVFFVGLQPIIANARPQSLDSYIFAAMTCLIEAAIFFPLILVERRITHLKEDSLETISTRRTSQYSIFYVWNRLF